MGMARVWVRVGISGTRTLTHTRGMGSPVGIASDLRPAGITRVQRHLELYYSNVVLLLVYVEYSVCDQYPKVAMWEERGNPSPKIRKPASILGNNISID